MKNYIVMITAYDSWIFNLGVAGEIWSLKAVYNINKFLQIFVSKLTKNKASGCRIISLG